MYPTLVQKDTLLQDNLYPLYQTIRIKSNRIKYHNKHDENIILLKSRSQISKKFYTVDQSIQLVKSTLYYKVISQFYDAFGITSHQLNRLVWSISHIIHFGELNISMNYLVPKYTLWKQDLQIKQIYQGLLFNTLFDVYKYILDLPYYSSIIDDLLQVLYYEKQYLNESLNKNNYINTYNNYIYYPIYYYKVINYSQNDIKSLFQQSLNDTSIQNQLLETISNNIPDKFPKILNTTNLLPSFLKMILKPIILMWNIDFPFYNPPKIFYQEQQLNKHYQLIIFTNYVHRFIFEEDINNFFRTRFNPKILTITSNYFYQTKYVNNIFILYQSIILTELILSKYPEIINIDIDFKTGFDEDFKNELINELFNKYSLDIVYKKIFEFVQYYRICKERPIKDFPKFLSNLDIQNIIEYKKLIKVYQNKILQQSEQSLDELLNNIENDIK